MNQIRRSFALASADRYFAVIVNFMTLLFTARLLAPGEFGVAVIGLSVLVLAETLHDFGGSAYVVQVDHLTPRRVHAVFTLTFILTFSIALCLFLSAGLIARFYNTPGLQGFLQIASICFLLGAFVTPVLALMRRNFEFGKLAVFNAASTVTNAIVTIVLALLDFSYMSFAWGSLLGALVYLSLCWGWGPQEPIYRFTTEGWRDLSEYGVYDSLKKLLHYAMDAVPMLAFGKILGADGVGLFQRAMSISRLPEKTLLAGLTSVLLPTLSAHARGGGDQKTGLLTSIEYVTALFWPALVVIAILAGPIVDILLGHQWTSTVPLIQIIAIAFLFQLPSSIANSVQIAAGAIRDSFTLALVTIPPAIALQIYAATHGLEMAAASLFVICPFTLMSSLVMIRWRVSFTWSELGAVMKSSAMVTLVTALGPTAVALYYGGTRDIPVGAGLLGMLTTPFGWILGLRIARHPMLHEVIRFINFLLVRILGETTSKRLLTTWLS